MSFADPIRQIAKDKVICFNIYIYILEIHKSLKSENVVILFNNVFNTVPIISDAKFDTLTYYFWKHAGRSISSNFTIKEKRSQTITFNKPYYSIILSASSCLKMSIQCGLPWHLTTYILLSQSIWEPFAPLR